MTITTIVNGLILVSWLVAAVVIGLGIATLGTEEAVLSKQRGADLRTRQELAFSRSQLRATMDTEIGRLHLERAVARLGLNLAPRSTEPGARGGGAVELADAAAGADQRRAQ
jgi:hypothetical protein